MLRTRHCKYPYRSAARILTSTYSTDHGKVNSPVRNGIPVPWDGTFFPRDGIPVPWDEKSIPRDGKSIPRDENLVVAWEGKRVAGEIIIYVEICLYVTVELEAVHAKMGRLNHLQQRADNNIEGRRL